MNGRLRKILQRTITGLLSVALVITMIPVSSFSAHAYAAESNAVENLSDEIQYKNLFFYQLRTDGLHITRAVKDQHFDENGKPDFEDRCMIKSLNIPDTLDVNGTAYPVQFIDGVIGSTPGAFSDCINLRELRLPENLQEIGAHAFSGCDSLQEVSLPQGLKVLGCGSFQECESLKKINIPPEVRCGKYAGDVAYPGPFAGDENLTDVTLDPKLDRIDNAMFKSSGITELEIPDSVLAIGSKAFQNTKKLKNVTISKNSRLEQIGWSGFDGSGITSIYLPDSLTFADVAAFAYCTDLKTVRMSEKLEVNPFQLERGYDTGIFRNCTSLKNIIFPEGLEKIGSCWFYDSPIESITIPASVKEIGPSAFRYCKNLKEVLFEDPDALRKIGPYAFRNDSALQDFEFPNNLNTIDSFAFQNCGLVEAYLPSSLEKMNEGALSGCKDLAAVLIPAKMRYDGGNISGGYGTGAFQGCDGLKTVDFEKGVTQIDNGLLGWNNGLTEITIPEGVTRIGCRAFRRDYNLQKVTLPESLKTIEKDAFSDCTSLGTIIFKGDRPEVTASICDNVVADVEFGIWDMIPDNWGGNLNFNGEIIEETDELRTSVNSPFQKNYVALQDASKKPWTNFRDYSAALYRDQSVLIPGIDVTNLGNNIACNKMTMQGVCKAGNYYLITAYCKCGGKHPSVLYVLDNTGKYLTTINTGIVSHFGAISYSHAGKIYIADELNVRYLTYEDIESCVREKKDSTSCVPKIAFKMKGSDIDSIGFLSCYGEGILVGAFGEKDLSEKNSKYFLNGNYMYDCSYEGHIRSRMTLPVHSQGVGIVDNYRGVSYLICSSSYQAKNKSDTIIMPLARDNNGNIVLPGSYKSTGYRMNLKTPNMSEDLEVYGNHVLQGFESAAHFYADGFDNEGKERSKPELDKISVSLDRVTNLSFSTMVRKAAKKSQKKGSANDTSDAMEEVIAEGICGQDAYWTLYGDGAIVINGTGSMDNYSQGDPAPWSTYAGDIKEVYIGGEISSIGDYAFYNCASITRVEYSDFCDGSKTLRIGKFAFAACPSLGDVFIPDVPCNIDDDAFVDSDQVRLNSDSESVQGFGEQSGINGHKHDFSKEKTVATTCAEPGYDLYACNCGVTEIRNVVDATGQHDYELTSETEPTENEEGIRIYTCKNCGYTFEEEVPIQRTAKSYLKKTSFTYTGKKVKPVVVVHDEDTYEDLVPGKDYTVSYPTNRTKIGQHRLIIKFIGNYGHLDPETKWFRIYPAKAGLKSARAGKKSLTVKAKAQKGGVRYQIAVKLKTAKKWKTYTITKTSKTIKGLKSKKQYQVRIRAFKKANGKNWYGAWSKVKTIKVK